ncbi:hypothetical protein N3K66_000860 [Trichothecium roseum]|uniref:Uncharacterized protein n=1 Tax=Trichothecium roseum TaxID=47278 RepID=A0ACC0VCY4_9HYPO|nr:hypothetical protein N3K66_000860 [Trichothecium roseum]
MNKKYHSDTDLPSRKMPNPHVASDLEETDNGDDVFGSPSNNHADEKTEHQALEMQKDDENEKALVPSQQPDPQTIYSSSGCVFVANLAQKYEDDALEAEITKEFSQWGCVFVKIRRDRGGMPYAFVQFTKTAEADAAIEGSNGQMILGRPCRAEKAKANSIFLVVKRDDTIVERHEALGLLHPFGEIEKVEELDHSVAEGLGVRNGVIVFFLSYDANRDVVQSMKKHDIFLVRAFDPMRPQDTDLSWRAGRKALMDLYDKDRRSVQFKTLHFDVGEEELREICAPYGTVVELQIISRYASPDCGPYNRSAVVEFSRVDQVEECLAQTDGKVWKGHRLSTQRKPSDAFNYPTTPPRYGSRSASFSRGSSTPASNARRGTSINRSGARGSSSAVQSPLGKYGDGTETSPTGSWRVSQGQDTLQGPRWPGSSRYRSGSYKQPVPQFDVTQLQRGAASPSFTRASSGAGPACRGNNRGFRPPAPQRQAPARGAATNYQGSSHATQPQLSVTSLQSSEGADTSQARTSWDGAQYTHVHSFAPSHYFYQPHAIAAP